MHEDETSVPARDYTHSVPLMFSDSFLANSSYFPSFPSIIHKCIQLDFNTNFSTKNHIPTNIPKLIVQIYALILAAMSTSALAGISLTAFDRNDSNCVGEPIGN